MLISQSVIIAVLIFIVGIPLLQIFLSRRESKWPGLVLPVIGFIVSLIYPLSMRAPSQGVTAWFILQMITVWLLSSIPTMVLLAIYFGFREKKRRNRQLDKMNIQDLN